MQTDTRTTTAGVLLTEREAASRLHVNYNSLRLWRYLGKGPRYVQLGVLIRYRLSDIEAFIDGRTVDPSRRGPDVPDDAALARG